MATWRLWIAPLVWAVHFMTIYAVTTLACTRQGAVAWLDIAFVPWFIGAATLLAAVLLVSIVQAARTGTSAAPAADFLRWLTIAIANLALLAVLWNAVPVLLVPICE